MTFRAYYAYFERINQNIGLKIKIYQIKSAT